MQLSASHLVEKFTDDARDKAEVCGGLKFSAPLSERDYINHALNETPEERGDADKPKTGVSLDAEAAKLLQFQQAYSAMGKFISVLNDLTDTVMNIIRT